MVAISTVQRAMDSGLRGDLAMAVKHLQEVISSPSKSQGISREPTDAIDSDDITARRCSVNEEVIMDHFGEALRKVAKERDTYTDTACDVCEQLYKDLLPLRSYESRKGFDSQKMEEIIELLYINKTRHEDIAEFMDNTLICKYCADRLRNNKDVARSIFNHLSVVPTPQCIKDLNLFEKTLIKQRITKIHKYLCCSTWPDLEQEKTPKRTKFST